MHGSAWSGDGGRMLLDLADALAPVAAPIPLAVAGGAA
jgi:hypothetical protein